MMKISFVISLVLVLSTQCFCSSAVVTPRSPQRAAVITTPKTTKATTAQPQPRAVQCTPNASLDLNDPRQAVDKHPVSRLHEIQAKDHEKEPIFKVIGHRGEHSKHNQEFNVQVTVKDKTASAWGYTKKDAKRRAAIEMLNQLGLAIKADDSNTIC